MTEIGALGMVNVAADLLSLVLVPPLLSLLLLLPTVVPSSSPSLIASAALRHLGPDYEAESHILALLICRG